MVRAHWAIGFGGEAKAEAKPKKVDLKPLDVECISSSCSSTSDSDEVQGTAAERAKQKVENFKTLLQEKGPGLDWPGPYFLASD